jgi:hypothetical protein
VSVPNVCATCRKPLPDDTRSVCATCFPAEVGDRPLETWAVVELMGHVRIAGRVTEEEKFGGKLGRLDIPTEDGGFVTQYFGASSVYRLTIVSEEAARAVATNSRVEPVHSWELPKQLVAAREPQQHDEDEPDDDDQWTREPRC